ncbi:unnamed protein product, partial [Effrenium voratum]
QPQTPYAGIRLASLHPPNDAAMRTSAYKCRSVAGAHARPKTAALDELRRTLRVADSKACTTIFSALGRETRWADACSLLRQLRLDAVGLDTIAHNAVIKACERGSQWPEALRLFGEVGAPDLVTFNTTISALQRGHEWQQALLLADQVQVLGLRGDKVTCAASLQACERGGRWDLALQLLAEFRQQGQELDQVCLNSAVSACGRCRQWQWAISLLEQSRPDVVTYNAAMDACRGQQWQRCLTLLNEMFHSVLYPSIISYNIAISSCEQGPWQLVLELLKDLKLQGLKPRADTLSAAMQVCSKAHQAEMALNLLSELPRSPARQLLVAHNTALHACARGQLWLRSLQLLDQMSTVAITPDVLSFTSAVTATGKVQQWAAAMVLLEEAHTRQLGNSWLLNAAVDGCSRAFQWQAALTVLRTGSPSMIAHSLAVSACAAAGSTRASQLLQEMLDGGLAPDQQAIVGMMAACKEGGLWALALQLLDVLAGFCVPIEETSQQPFSLAIGACDAAGQWESVLAVLARMQDQGPAPNAVALNAACSSLMSHGLLAEALCLFREAKEAGLNAECLDFTNPADLDLHVFPVDDLAKLAVLEKLLEAAISTPRGVCLITGRGLHGEGDLAPVLTPVLCAWLREELGLAVEDGASLGNDGRLWVPESALQELSATPTSD